MNRQEEKSNLIYQLGLLLCPLEDMAKHPKQYDQDKRTRAIARFDDDRVEFTGAVSSFTEGEPGHSYQAHRQSMLVALHGLSDWLHTDWEPEALPDFLEEHRNAILTQIAAIPVSAETEILEAHSPFSTYCKIKDLCQTATEILVFVDRYLDASVFYRYLRDLSPQVSVTLVTWPLEKGNSQVSAEFRDISRMYAAEHGPEKYRLVVHESIHDRWLRCDDQMFQLGSSFKDAGATIYSTLSKLGSPEENLQELNHLLTTGTELYGPTQDEHP